MKLRIETASLLLGVGLALPALGAPACPSRPAAPREPAFRLDADSLAVPMESWRGLSVVEVTLDGHGPFRFVLDTGAQGSVIAKSLADSLGFPVVGEAQVGSPIGDQPVPAKVVRIGRLAVGGRLSAEVSCVALDLPMGGPTTHLGVLSPTEFPGLLVTWDFARRRVQFQRGALPAPDGAHIFSYEGEPLPTVPVEVADRRMLMHVDTGSAGGLTLPAALQDSLPLAGPPVEGRLARTVNREMRLLDARLAGTVVVGSHTLANPTIELNPLARVANIGSQVLKDFTITLDARQQRIRLQPAGAPEASDAVGAHDATRPPPAAAGAKPGAAELAAIAPGLVNAMIPLPGVATAGMPQAEHYAALARAGYRTVVDLCLPEEPRGYDEPRAVRAAGLEYVAIPFTRTTMGAAQVDEFRRVMGEPARRPSLVHCAGATRVGGIMLPYLVLDQRMTEEEALALARQIGLRSPELEAAGLEYVRARHGETR